MKITLIKAGAVKSVLPFVGQPLGIMYLAAVAREAGHKVQLIDAKSEGLSSESAIALAEGFAPDLVGISGFTNEWESFEQLGRLSKQKMPRVTLVGGGPYATSFPKEILQRTPFDYLVLGEGERTFLDLLESLSKDGSPHKVRGLAYRENGVMAYSPAQPLIEDLDALPIPAYDLLDMDLYTKHITASPIGRRRNMTVMTARGCPYRCIYCHNIFGKRFRAKSVDKVIEEWSLLARTYKIRHFEICDDIFNFDRDRLMAICDRVVKENLDIRLSFPTGLRGDRMDGEMIAALKRAGTVMISYAVESASPRIQTLSKKNMVLDKISRTIKETVRQGIFTHAFFMLGFPDETEEEMKLTLDFALRSNLHTASFFIVTPFKATELWDYVPENLRDSAPDDWFSFQGGYVNLSSLPDRRLMSIRQKAYLRFYMNPWRASRILIRHPNRRFLPEALLILLRQIRNKPPSGRSGR